MVTDSSHLQLETERLRLTIEIEAAENRAHWLSAQLAYIIARIDELDA